MLTPATSEDSVTCSTSNNEWTDVDLPLFSEPREEWHVEVGDLVGGRFELQALAKDGGMGSVYRARDRCGGGTVAVKVLRGTKRNRARFLREASVLERLRHPFIVGHVAHGEVTASMRYLAMSWLDGEDLRDRLTIRGQLTLEETVGMGRCIAQALVAAHRQGIIHRDIKPDNVFLVRRDAGCAKLLDFGVARLVRDAGLLTEQGQQIGTLGYMSPEQAWGDMHVEGPADVFSLGCLLFRCLMGVTPFAGGTPGQVLTRLLVETPPRIRSLRRDVPKLLDALVMQMLATQPSERPTSRTVALTLAEITRSLSPGT